MLCTIVKYWNRILLMEQDELLICCYERQEGNWKSANGARNLSDKLHRLGLGYVWLDRDRRDLKSICQN